MNKTVSVQEIETKKEAKEQLELQLAQYLEPQPESTQVFHKWMKRLEVASLVLIAATFILAMYVSINWTAVQKTFIPIAWFIFAASVTPTMVLIGIHSIILRAFPPIVLPGKMQKFVTGSGAMWSGWGFILGGLAVAAFWGLFAYSVWTLNLAMLKPLITILAVVLGVGIAVSIVFSIVYSIFRSVFRSISRSQ